MRKLVALLALTVAAFAAQVPRKAPEFVIHTQDGKQTLLSSYRGKTVVLALMFTTCPHCQKLSGELNGIQRDYASKGVQVLGAVWDPTAERNLKPFIAAFAQSYPVGYSNNTSVLQFLSQPVSDPPFVPIVLLIDKTGTIRDIHMVTGETPSDSPEQKFFQQPDASIRAELDKMLKGSAVSSRR
ncbi:MAG: TlpA family protein disulfide reductase [Acidobacteriota bacterium]|nr:TlpA family protein disulfide reductase [Acidobacteriota bacterium]